MMYIVILTLMLGWNMPAMRKSKKGSHARCIAYEHIIQTGQFDANSKCPLALAGILNKKPRTPIVAVPVPVRRPAVVNVGHAVGNDGVNAFFLDPGKYVIEYGQQGVLGDAMILLFRDEP